MADSAHMPSPNSRPISATTDARERARGGHAAHRRHHRRVHRGRQSRARKAAGPRQTLATNWGGASGATLFGLGARARPDLGGAAQWLAGAGAGDGRQARLVPCPARLDRDAGCAGSRPRRAGATLDEASIATVVGYEVMIRLGFVGGDRVSWRAAITPVRCSAPSAVRPRSAVSSAPRRRRSSMRWASAAPSPPASRNLRAPAQPRKSCMAAGAHMPACWRSIWPWPASPAPRACSRANSASSRRI